MILLETACRFSTLARCNSPVPLNGKFGPGTGTIINLETDDGEVHTNASFTSDTVSVKFIGKAHPN